MTRIFITAMNYAPEFAGVGRYTGEIGEHLSEMGHDVTRRDDAAPLSRVEGHAALPQLVPIQVERQGRVKIIRCPLILRERDARDLAVGRAFVLCRDLGARRLLAGASPPPANGAMHRADADVTAPIAIIAARLVGARTVLHVQDLEVDASFAVGHLGAKALAQENRLRLRANGAAWLLTG